VKYPTAYELPDEAAVERLLNGVLDLGINHIDTAPAYGSSEERIGKFLSGRRAEYLLSTKVGEVFEGGESRYEFDAMSVRQSVERSLRKLRTERVEIVLIHSPSNDVAVMRETAAVETLIRLREEGTARCIGLSAKTVEGARSAMEWADVLMVEYHLHDRAFEGLIREAAGKGIGVIVKKGLGAGHLPAAEAIPFVMQNPGVSNLVVGSLNLEHLQGNLESAARA
jgi:aryl-alcohol dehydrogenase-like predicted oxidoreductase